MGLTQIVFMGAMLGALTTAFAHGGMPERLTAALLFAAAILSPFLFDPSQSSTQWHLAALDFLVLLGLHMIAQRWPRRWLDFAHAFQLLTVMTHIARFLADEASQIAYTTLLILWSYPVLACLAWGAWNSGERGRRQTTQSMIGQVGDNADLTASESNDLALATRLLEQNRFGAEAHRHAAHLLELCGNLPAAFGTPPSQLRTMGVDDRVVDALVLARELGNRLLLRSIECGPIVTDGQALLDYLHGHLSHLRSENFHVLFLDAHNRLIARLDQSAGSVLKAPVFARKLMLHALEVGAVNIIVSHNHPSGDLNPSREDILVTKQLRDLFRSVEINLLDHIIISRSGHLSLQAAGFL